MQPKVYLVGHTDVDYSERNRYLEDTDNFAFLEDIDEAALEGISAPEILCSTYAKLCYKSLTPGKNANIEKTRSISANLKSVIETGHGSILEHFYVNFIFSNVSRVFTHELVRHRAGTSFSQTSGRYVAIGEGNPLELVLDPMLEKGRPRQLVNEAINAIELIAKDLRAELIKEGMSFAEKKKITSAIRRIAPNGQANEIGFGANMRALRHIIEMRTSRAAEWEIRYVFNQVADLIKNRWPLMLWGGRVEEVDGMREWTNLKI